RRSPCVGSSAPRARGSQVAQRQFEIDGAFEWPWAQVAVLAGEADPQQVLVGADLGDRADRRVEANLHHLVALAPERLLVAAVLSRQHRPLRALAQQLEHDRKAV